MHPHHGPRRDLEHVEIDTLDWVHYLTGLLKSVTSPLGSLPGADPADYTTSYGYDPVGQLLEATRHDDTGAAVTTSFGYDDVGNQISVVDPRGNKAAQLGYDLNHRQTSSIDALGYAVRTRYDRDGQVTAVVDQRGNLTRYTYTPTGLLESVTVDHTPIGSLGGDHSRTTTFGYDAVGNRTRVTRPSGLFERVQYDANNRPIREYSAFDPNHPVAAYQTAAVIHLKYDPLGRLAQQSDPVRDPQAPQDWTTFDYYDSGDIKSSTDPWGIQTQYEYNKLGQQTKRTLLPETGAQADPRTMTWSYHPDGSLAARDDTAGPAVARVIGHTEADADGNWTTINPGGGQDSYLAHAQADAGSAEEGDTVTWRTDVAQTWSSKPCNSSAIVRMATLTTVMSSAARNMPSISPERIVRIWRWVKPPSAPAGARDWAASEVISPPFVSAIGRGRERAGRPRRGGSR